MYNSDLGDLYCHHDILLSSFPLAVEWMDYDIRDGNTGRCKCNCSYKFIVSSNVEGHIVHRIHVLQKDV